MIKKQKAFTLIELVIVIFILGVLSTLAFAKFNDVSKNANNRAIDANIRHIMDGIRIQAFIESTQPDDDLVQRVINSLNVNKIDVNYSGKILNFGIVLRYSSTVKKYSGDRGYKVEPTTEDDLTNSSIYNDGTPVVDAYFVYQFGKIE